MYAYSHNGQFPFRTLTKKNNSHLLKYEKKKVSLISLKNLNVGFKTLGISEATRKKIAFACRTLSFSSVSRTVRNGKGEYIKHHLRFITLTLPSEQVHTDKEITKLVLGTFLDRCRKLGFFDNYVWRAEKQKNGNIHYHILTDSYVSYSMLRNIWFISLRKYGYIKAYQEKFSKISYSEYRSLPFNSKKTETDISRAYARGVRNGWSEPPAIDVKDVCSADAVNAYISKYVSKDEAGSELNVSGRVWGCSQSVSLAGKSWKSDKEFAKFWFEAGQGIMKKKRIDKDWFSMVVFPLYSLLAWYNDVKEYVYKLLRAHFTPCEYWRNSMGLAFPT